MLARIDDAIAGLVPPVPSPNIELRWHVLLTEPSCERKAEANLRRQGFKPYVPVEKTVEYRHVRSMFGVHRRAYDSVRPIFRGYLFLPLNVAWSFGPIYTTPGLRQNGHPFLQHCDRYAILDDVAIELIRKVEEALHNPELPGLPYKVGDKVRVVEGAFLDFVAEIAQLHDAARIELLMDLLGQKTKFFASAHQIVIAD